MEIQQTKEPSAKQAQNWVPLSDIRELIDEYDEHAKLLRNHADINLKDKVAMQDRFMLHFWTTYPMRKAGQCPSYASPMTSVLRVVKNDKSCFTSTSRMVVVHSTWLPSPPTRV